MRVVAGPNGSGKSTLKSVIPPELLGVYVNADDIERTIREQGCLDFSNFCVESGAEQAVMYLKASPLLKKLGVEDPSAIGIEFEETKLHVDSGAVNAYVAAAIAGFLREELLRSGLSFTFETVM